MSDPNPSQWGQAPKGLLNEKVRGAGSSMEILQWAQANCSLNSTSSPLSGLLMNMMPPDCFSASSTESVSLFCTSGLITSRSTTSSILCFTFLSSRTSSSSSKWKVPSTRTRTNPSFKNCANRSRYSPLRPRTTGAKICIRVPSGQDSRLSTICWTVCRSTLRPHCGQCGCPTRANNRRK